MKRSWLSWLLILAFAVTLLSGSVLVRAQEEDDGPASDDGTDAGAGAGGTAEDDEVISEDDDAEKPEEPSGEAYDVDDEEAGAASEDIVVDATFPDFPDRKLKLGEPITLLVGMLNKGSKSYNVTWVYGHLHSAVDINYYVQNFTAQRVEGVTIGSHEQASLEYRFMPDPSLDALDFTFSAKVVYNSSDGRMYESLAISQPVTLVEGSGAGRNAAVYVIILAAVGLGAYVYLNQNKSSKKKQVERGTRTQADVEIYKQAPTAKKRK